MSVKGRIRGRDDGPRLAKFAARKIGPWAIFSANKSDFESCVSVDAGELDPFGLRLPGFWIVDARGRWEFDPEAKEVIVLRSATLMRGNSELPLLSMRSRVCLALIENVDLIPTNTLAQNPTYGTPTARIEISEIHRRLKIKSEVFVQPTRRGYVPAVHVEASNGTVYHLLIGAASLGVPLEELRLKYGQLSDLSIDVWKDSGGQFSRYTVKEASD